MRNGNYVIWYCVLKVVRAGAHGAPKARDGPSRVTQAAASGTAYLRMLATGR
jgi:hypothetical protein